MKEPLPIDEATRAVLQRYAFDEPTFAELAGRLRDGRAGGDHNRIRGEVTPPVPGDVMALPPLGGDARRLLADRGKEALAGGRVAVVILAGGMATRFGGVVKAAVPVVDDLTFLDLKVMDVQRVARALGARIPIYLMTSFATHAEVAKLADQRSTDEVPVRAFPQHIGIRLTPTGDVFLDGEGKPSLYATGHGDLTFALRGSGVLGELRAHGAHVLMMSNVDNLLATLDPAVVGAHLESGVSVNAEVAPKEPGDKGGAPARVDGLPQIVEAFRFPEDFDQDSIPVFNTNTLLFDTGAIDRDFDLTWFAVQKEVDGRPAVQFERLVGEVTAFLPSRFLRVERYGPDARFAPVKDPEELERRRATIVSALQARGVL